MPGGIQNDHLPSRYLAVHELDDVLLALEDQGRHGDFGKVGPVIGLQGHRAKALAISGSVRQKLLVSSSPSSGLRIAHDGGRHRSGPTHVVVLEKLEELLDLLLAEPAHIANVVDVARRRPTSTSRPNMPGAFRDARTPIIALTECPTKTASLRDNSFPISTTSSAR
jgi:hypothetical protein